MIPPLDPKHRVDFLYSAAKPLLFQLDAESAHHLTLKGMRATHTLGALGSLFPIDEHLHEPVEVMGLKFPNVVGLAAGMDKAGQAVDAFGAIGFGHVEVGTVTPRPQPGNEKPRLFRLVEHEAIINRMGFNNPGLEGVLGNLAESCSFTGVLGINIGKNFDTPNENAVDDYLLGLRGSYERADYLVVNLSSPNTKGLRDLQEISSCEALLQRLLDERDQLATEFGAKKPLAVKLAPDLSDDQLKGLAEMLSRIGIDAVIATNTTLDRSAVKGHARAEEKGGLSGGPLREMSLRSLELWRAELESAVPVISVGGIMDGEIARERIQAGAALVQVYTGLIYRGPALIREILAAVQKS